MKIETAKRAKELLDELDKTKSDRDAIFTNLKSLIKNYKIESDDKNMNTVSLGMSHYFDKVEMKINYEISQLKDAEPTR